MLDAIFTGQKNIVNQFKSNISSASSLRKGNFGEMASDVFLTEKGYKPLHTRIQNIDAPTHQGLDGVFQKGNEYFIVEAKYHGTATLNPANPTTGLPKQMTDSWITGGDRLLDAVGTTTRLEILSTGYRRLLAETAPDGSVIYKELDANANVIGIFNP